MSEVKDLERQIEQLRTQIQKSEKLSSLGTLSAGIAHEIQNPLNFVINFSQMANDMVDDLTDILDGLCVLICRKSLNMVIGQQISSRAY